MKKYFAVLVVPLLTGCWTSIRTGQVGVKYSALSRPALTEQVKTEGLYFRLPWNSYISYDVTWQSKTEAVEVLTADVLHVATDVTVTFRPDRTRIFDVARLIGRQYYEEIIRPPFLTIARAEFSRHLHNDLAKESPEIERQILAELRKAIGDKPLEVDRVSVNHVAYDPTVTKSISAKLAMQQMVEQKKFEIEVAERDAEIARTQAKGEADAIRIRAEGEGRAIVIRGEAQAAAQAAIAKTLSNAFLQYKAFDSPTTRYYFVPTGTNGLPIILGNDGAQSVHPPKADDSATTAMGKKRQP